MPKQRETAVLVMSDLHFGKATSSYDPDVFRKRLNQLSKRLERLRALTNSTSWLLLAWAMPTTARTFMRPSRITRQSQTLRSRLSNWHGCSTSLVSSRPMSGEKFGGSVYQGTMGDPREAGLPRLRAGILWHIAT